MKGNAILSEESHKALQAPEILEHIFQFCPYPDLLSCRQVSTVWNTSSFTKWRASTMVRLESREKMINFLDFVRETGAGNCYSNYRLRGYYLNEVTHPFWIYCGEYITTLELINYKFDSTENFRNVIYDRTPNMETLVLITPTVLDAERVPKPGSYEEPAFGENWNLRSLTIQLVPSIGISYMELLCHFPGLKTLKLPGLLNTQDWLFQSLLKIRRSHPEKLMLTEVSSLQVIFRGNWDINLNLVDILVDTGLQLEVVSFGVNAETCFSSLERIITANNSSLKKIQLNRFQREQANVLTRPIPIMCQLDNLAELEVHHELLASFQFLKFTPNLVSFSIVENTDESMRIPPQFRPQADSDENVPRRVLPQAHSEDLEKIQLTRCKAFKCSIQLSVKELDQIMNWLPNVERLTIRLDNDTFGLICERWGNLKSLDIEIGSSVDECWITIKNAEDVNGINLERLGPCTANGHAFRITEQYWKELRNRYYLKDSN